jgi:hypothetical protein
MPRTSGTAISPAAGKPLANGLAQPTPGAVSGEEALVHIVPADQPDGNNRIVAVDGHPGEAAAAFPPQSVLLASELADLSTPARKFKNKRTYECIV